MTERRRGFWYLASPYSNYPMGIDKAASLVAENAAMLFRADVLVFSPIAHTHEIAKAGEMPGHFEFWQTFDHVMIDAAIGVLVLTLVGWDESNGIKGEIEYCQSIGKPVLYVSPGVAPITDEEMRFHPSEETE